MNGMDGMDKQIPSAHIPVSDITSIFSLRTHTQDSHHFKLLEGGTFA